MNNEDVHQKKNMKNNLNSRDLTVTFHLKKKQKNYLYTP